MGRGTHREVRDGTGILPVVRDGSGDSPGVLARVGGHSQKSGISRGTL